MSHLSHFPSFIQFFMQGLSSHITIVVRGNSHFIVFNLKPSIYYISITLLIFLYTLSIIRNPASGLYGLIYCTDDDQARNKNHVIIFLSSPYNVYNIRECKNCPMKPLSTSLNQIMGNIFLWRKVAWSYS